MLSFTPSIVALHGLNGSSIKTWTAPCPKSKSKSKDGRKETHWLRDLLPHDFPKARIMTFGYDATAAFTDSTAGIAEHARDLLSCLMLARNHSAEASSTTADDETGETETGIEASETEVR